MPATEVSLDNIISLEDANSVDNPGTVNKFLSLIRTVLSDEYSGSRLNKADYSKVLSSSISSALTQAVQFELAAAQANAQLQLTTVQTQQAEKELILQDISIDQARENLRTARSQRALIDLQTTKVEKENALITQQILNAQEQVLKSQAEVLLVNAQVAGTTASNLNIPKEGLRIDQQTAKLLQDTLLTASQKTLMDQKLITERAQTETHIDGVKVTGTIGDQSALYQRQSEGYLRDAEEKLLKIFGDTYSVERSTTPDTSNRTTNGMDDLNYKKVVEKALNGIGVTPT